MSNYFNKYQMLAPGVDGGGGGASTEEFRVDSGAISNAKSEFIALGLKYKDVANKVETALNRIGNTAWPTGGPAKDQFDTKAQQIRIKLAAINSKFVTNQKVFDLDKDGEVSLALR